MVTEEPRTNPPCLFKSYPSLLTLSYKHSFTPSYHLTIGLPLLGPSITLHKLFFLSIWSNHLKVFGHPFHYTTLHFICTSSHATSSIHAFIALTLPSCHATCSSQITHFHTTLSFYLFLLLDSSSFYIVLKHHSIRRSVTLSSPVAVQQQVYRTTAEMHQTMYI